MSILSRIGCGLFAGLCLVLVGGALAGAVYLIYLVMGEYTYTLLPAGIFLLCVLMLISEGRSKW